MTLYPHLPTTPSFSVSLLLQQDQLCDCAESVVGELYGSERWQRQAGGRRRTTVESHRERERECAIEREREEKKN